MQVGGVSGQGSLLRALVQQQNSANGLAHVHQTARAKSEALATSIRGASEERNEAPDGDEGRGRLNVLA